MHGNVRRLLPFAALSLTIAVAATTAMSIRAARASPDDNEDPADEKQGPEPSGVYDFRTLDIGTALTECPQAGIRRSQPKPLDQRDKDALERISEGGDDIRLNQD